MVFGHYTQDGIVNKDDLKVIEVVQEIGEYITLKKGQKLTASQLCERFLFDSHQQYSYVSTLSGGERRRLFLLTILMKNPNFLILDEPTNDLDILTLQALEGFLEEYSGCLLVVSHDRYFWINCVTTSLFSKAADALKTLTDATMSGARSRRG